MESWLSPTRSQQVHLRWYGDHLQLFIGQQQIIRCSPALMPSLPNKGKEGGNCAFKRYNSFPVLPLGQHSYITSNRRAFPLGPRLQLTSKGCRLGPLRIGLDKRIVIWKIKCLTVTEQKFRTVWWQRKSQGVVPSNNQDYGEQF